MPLDLSIIIPVLNERRKISRDILEAATFLTENRLAGEIIVVDDGSTDDTAQVAANTETPSSVALQVIRYEQNRGKGYAVKTGILASKGDYVMFADSGSCVPYRYALVGMNMIKAGECEVAHGSRKLKQTIIHRPQKLTRRLSSWVFRWIMILWMKVPKQLTDTQCGFKIYRGDIGRELYGECLSKRFAFDVEIILRATIRGYRIKEFPIEWSSDPDSRISLLKNAWPVIKDLWKIRRLVITQ